MPRPASLNPLRSLKHPRTAKSLLKSTSRNIKWLRYAKGQRWDQVFPATALFLEHRRPGQARTLALEQHEAVTVFEHQAGASVEKAQPYPVEAGES